MAIHIALEGIDNSGKTTVASLLVEKLNFIGINTILKNEFSSCYGSLLKARLYSIESRPSPREKVLAFALDRLIRYEEIDDSVEIVVWDRYVLSAVIYRSVEGVDENWVKSVNSIFPVPDLHFYIDVNPSASTSRGQLSGKGCPYNEDFLGRCRTEYLKYVSSGTLKLIDGETPLDQVNKITKLVENIKGL